MAGPNMSSSLVNVFFFDFNSPVETSLNFQRIPVHCRFQALKENWFTKKKLNYTYSTTRGSVLQNTILTEKFKCYFPTKTF